MTDKQWDEEVAGILYQAADLYEKTMTKGTIHLYLNTLEPYPAEIIGQAMTEHVKTSKWFPKPSELIDIIEASTQPSLSLEARAELEAMNVLKMIRYHGQRYKNGWQDPVTARLMSSRFSYSNLCNDMRSDQEQWFVKEFKAAYCAGDELETKVQIEAHPKVLKLADHIGRK